MFGIYEKKAGQLAKLLYKFETEKEAIDFLQKEVMPNKIAIWDSNGFDTQKIKKDYDWDLESDHRFFYDVWEWYVEEILFED